MAKILITGSSGFVGRHLVPYLQRRGHTGIEAGRNRRSGADSHVFISDIGPDSDWTGKLHAVDAVVHLAGLAHRKASDDDFFSVNDAGTKRLVEACQYSGVRSFVLLSSIAARRAEEAPDRANAYGRSKLAGERHVIEAVRQDGMTGIALRPPLVYGHDAPGNWRRLQQLSGSGLPLPFGSIHNHRSHCSIDNLCNAILVALEAALQDRGSGIYEIADREQVSLAQIITWLRQGMEKGPGLVPVPAGMLHGGLRLLGQAKLIEALLDDLVLDPSSFMREFNWTPPENAKEAIRKSGRLFLQGK